MPTPVRTIRIADDLWTKVEATAEAERVDVSTVVRNALSAYVKAAGVAVVALLAVLLLGACGGAEPAAQPVSEPSVTATSELITEPTSEPQDETKVYALGKSVDVDLDGAEDVGRIRLYDAFDRGPNVYNPVLSLPAGGVVSPEDFTGVTVDGRSVSPTDSEWSATGGGLIMFGEAVEFVVFDDGAVTWSGS